MQDFRRLNRLPPYIFTQIDELKRQAQEQGKQIIDFGMGNPDQPTPPHIVEALIKATASSENHRYSVSRGILPLRQAICTWYQRHGVEGLDPHTETVVTLGSKEGLSHLALAITDPGDTVLVPTPAYPIHTYGFVIAGASVRYVSLNTETDFFANLQKAISQASPKPKVLVLNFPSNPTTACADLSFFAEVVKIAKRYNIWVIHDYAYADLVFDGYQAPSILQVPGAKDIAVETFTLSKSYNMPGWRVGFVCGNATLIKALTKIKSYFDYGIFAPIQQASILALEGSQQCVTDICKLYQQRRDILCEQLNNAGWSVNKPKATMFVWAKIPERFISMGSLKFTQLLLEQANIAVSPGIGFGDAGDSHVRFALVVDEINMRMAGKAIKQLLEQKSSDERAA